MRTSTLSSTLTDNWSLQLVAEHLLGRVDPNRDATIIDVSDAGMLVEHVVPNGALQLLAFADFLEQLVFADSLMVLDGWLDPWRDQSPDMDLLLNSGIIRALSADHVAIDEAHEGYLRELCSIPAIAEEHSRTKSLWLDGEPTVSGQVINGTAHYLAIADCTNRTYWPHPARGRLLRRTLHSQSARRARVEHHLSTLVNESRVKLRRMLGQRNEVLALSYAMPAAAVLCFAESSTVISPLQVALQVRNNAAFVALRETLNRTAIEAQKDLSKALKTIAELERTLMEAERELGMNSPPLTVDVSFSTFTGGPSVELPLRAPGALARPLWNPRHTAVLTRLIRAGRLPVSQLLRDRFGLGSARVLRAIDALTSDEAVPPLG